MKYGVDEDVCNGDHACIRLSGCPTLTLKDNPDPLKVDPVATVIDGCVGCGLCGENAHAATLCPSFYRAEVVQQPAAGTSGCSTACAARCVRCAATGMNDATPHTQPITLLVCALGGEGGGVLTEWLVDAAARMPAMRRRAPRSPASRSAPAPPPTTSRCSRCRWPSSAAAGRCSA